MMDMEEEIIQLRLAVSRIETKLNSFPICPMPGECLRLNPRVRALEDLEQQRKGSWFSVTIIATLLASLATWLISWFKTRGG